MHHILSLKLNSIRSYKNPQELKFSNVTLIVGQNGSGKTSIIESLRYVLTGDLPSFRSFVYSPKILRTDVFAHIVVYFGDFCVKRSLACYFKNLSQRSLESVIAYGDFRTESTRNNCEDENEFENEYSKEIGNDYDCDEVRNNNNYEFDDRNITVNERENEIGSEVRKNNFCNRKLDSEKSSLPTNLKKKRVNLVAAGNHKEEIYKFGCKNTSKNEILYGKNNFSGEIAKNNFGKDEYDYNLDFYPKLECDISDVNKKIHEILREDDVNVKNRNINNGKEKEKSKNENIFKGNSTNQVKYIFKEKDNDNDEIIEQNSNKNQLVNITSNISNGNFARKTFNNTTNKKDENLRSEIHRNISKTAINNANVFENIKKGEKTTSTSAKHADTTTQLLHLLNTTSPLILDVCLCHQDDQYWPINDLKKKIDQIFNTTSYSKLIDIQKQLKKSVSSKIDLKESEIKFLSTNRLKNIAAKKCLERDNARCSEIECEMVLVEQNINDLCVDEINRTVELHLKDEELHFKLVKELEILKERKFDEFYSIKELKDLLLVIEHMVFSCMCENDKIESMINANDIQISQNIDDPGNKTTNDVGNIFNNLSGISNVNESANINLISRVYENITLPGMNSTVFLNSSPKKNSFSNNPSITTNDNNNSFRNKSINYTNLSICDNSNSNIVHTNKENKFLIQEDEIKKSKTMINDQINGENILNNRKKFKKKSIMHDKVFTKVNEVNFKSENKNNKNLKGKQNNSSIETSFFNMTDYKNYEKTDNLPENSKLNDESVKKEVEEMLILKMIDKCPINEFKELLKNEVNRENMYLTNLDKCFMIFSDLQVFVNNSRIDYLYYKSFYDNFCEKVQEIRSNFLSVLDDCVNVLGFSFCESLMNSFLIDFLGISNDNLHVKSDLADKSKKSKFIKQKTNKNMKITNFNKDDCKNMSFNNFNKNDCKNMSFNNFIKDDCKITNKINTLNEKKKNNNDIYNYCNENNKNSDDTNNKLINSKDDEKFIDISSSNILLEKKYIHFLSSKNISELKLQDIITMIIFFDYSVQQFDKRDYVTEMESLTKKSNEIDFEISKENKIINDQRVKIHLNISRISEKTKQNLTYENEINVLNCDIDLLKEFSNNFTDNDKYNNHDLNLDILKKRCK
ncbi:hypothetical protein EDEG_02455 [Edhazardia aedis USNM 41457]|uniref:Rad50/SbcC-type AAA domain-containing protein n=1 Tax=Edhazardia aedis (strain USNM 41457) TaxID=1003232 RepID=J9DKN5_EDHAE|nr:hypothetical protein EDEG_02455 [Edhazardia aedis USNM 41457]|eukprot:EJW03150.1 hypothetical protein EDEG_02455 [Edhazardia aedis USNM 41457]